MNGVRLCVSTAAFLYMILDEAPESDFAFAEQPLAQARSLKLSDSRLSVQQGPGIQ
jgi:hypothetical protein